MRHFLSALRSRGPASQGGWNVDGVPDGPFVGPSRGVDGWCREDGHVPQGRFGSPGVSVFDSTQSVAALLPS